MNRTAVVGLAAVCLVALAGIALIAWFRASPADALPQTYRNTAYGFSLRIPADYNVTEAPNTNPREENGVADVIELSNPSGSVQLTIAYASYAHSNTAALSNGLVGHWPLNGPSTSFKTNTTQDTSGNGNTGTLVSMSTTTSPTPGKIGQALNFNGTNNYISVPHNASFIPTTLTVTSWIKTTATALDRVVSHDDGSGGFAGFETRINASAGKFSFWVGGSAWTDGSVTINDGKWHFVVGRYDGTNVVTFVDGKQDATQAQTANFTTTSVSAIGKYAGGNSNFYSGTIDDVRIYNRALSAQEVYQLWLMGK